MKTRGWMFIRLLLLAAVLCACVQPEAPSNVATVVETVNQVDAHPRPVDNWEAAALGMNIFGGGQVRTGADSSARLELLEGIVRVWAESVFTVRESTTREGRLVTRVFLQQGRLWAHLSADQPHEFTVETASAVAAVRDTRFSVRVGPDQSVLVSVAEGEVELTAQEESVRVAEGEQATVDAGEPPSPPEPMSEEEHALWTTEGEMPELPAVPTPTPTVASTPSSPTATSAPRSPTATPIQAATPTPTPPGDAKIAFVRGGDLWIMNPDGSDQRQITSGITVSFRPSWSPNGTQMALSVLPDIYVVNVVEGNLEKLTQRSNDCPASDPSWSPDGTRIVYFDGCPGGGIAVMDIDSGNQVVLSEAGGFPAWSPDGKRIAFTGPGGLNVMNADGSGKTSIVDDNIWYPSWSPDGTRIAYSGFEGIVSTVGVDGSGLVELVEGISPTWSPDGSEIAFGRIQADGDTIYVVNADGSGMEAIARGSYPAWSPVANSLPSSLPTPLPPPPPTPAPTPEEQPMSIDFRVDRAAITPGECVNLSWNVTGAGVARIEINDIEAPLQGSYQHCPDASFSYHLEALDAGGTVLGSKTISVDVNVSPSPGVSIDLVANPDHIRSGGCTMLSWSVAGAGVATVKINVIEVQLQGQYQACLEQDTDISLVAYDVGWNVIGSKTIRVTVSDVGW